MLTAPTRRPSCKTQPNSTVEPLSRVQIGHRDTDSHVDFGDRYRSRSGQRWGSGFVTRAGGRDELRCVRAVFVTGDHTPARSLLGVVASFAKAEPVRCASGSAAVVRLGMVEVPDWGITVRRAASL